MNRTIDKILSGVGAVLHILIVPIFVFVFTIYYRPYGTYQLLDMGDVSFAFNVTIIFCILLGSMTITRVWLYFLGKFKQLSRTLYLIWCVGEIIVAALFSSLYIVLVSADDLSFFEVAGSFFVKLLCSAIYPYAFLWLGFELNAANSEDVDATDDNSLIRFYDEYKKLRFVITSEAVIFIKSEDNYVQIHYQDQNRLKKFVLRSSMRALEENLSKHGLVRCHRSYFINPAFIKIVHRDESGIIVAELNRDGYESIPISRKYQDAVTRLL